MTATRPTRARPSQGWLLCLGLAAVAILTGGLLAAFAPSVAVRYGLPPPGLLLDAGLPAARVLALGAAAGVVGSLLLATVLAPGEPDGPPSPAGHATLRTAAACAVVQAGASVVVAVLTMAENTGLPLHMIGRLLANLGQLEQAAGWALSALVAAEVAVFAAWVTTWRGTVGLLVLALAGLLPLTATAVTNAERSHDITGDALTLHVLGAVLWLGSTVAVVAHLARGGDRTEVVLRRHAAIASWSLPLVGVSGVVSAAYAITPVHLLDSGYGLLVLAGAALLPALVVAGHLTRRAVARGRVHAAALRLAAVELALLTVAAGTGTALTRLLPPADAGYRGSLSVSLLGYDLPATLTALDLILRWRLDLIFGPLAVLAAVLYLAGVRRLRAAGGHWPRGRIVSWLGGCAVLLVATSSGIGTYGPAVFSVHMVQHTLLAGLAPVLLVLGHPVTLANDVAADRTARRLGTLLDAPAVRLACHPMIAWLAVALTLVGLYPTGMFGAILHEHWAHLAMDAAFFLTGLALFGSVLGHRPPAHEMPAIGRIVVVFAVMALHAAFSVWLLSRATPVGADFYDALDLPFVPDLLADQRRGALLGWALGELPVLLAVLALVGRWIQADRVPDDQPLDARQPDRWTPQLAAHSEAERP